MPRKRQPREIWEGTRRRVWERDGGRCQSPDGPHKEYCTGAETIALDVCHIDHIKSGKLGTNEMSNLRVLCPACHALRNDHRHQSLTRNAVKKGFIPPDWRPLAWDDA